MKKYLWLVCLESVVFVLLLSFKTLADEVALKTDSSFVGEDTQQPINSSFVGDVSNSMVNDSWGKEDTLQKTDSAFAGSDNFNDDGNLFAGSNFDKQVKEQSDAAFVGNQTFAGSDYGK